MIDIVQAIWDQLRQGGRGVIITGPMGSGKTRTAANVAVFLSAQGIVVGGVISPRLVQNGETMGYLVRDLSTGDERLLCSFSPPGLKFRRFYFSPDGLAFANAVLKQTTLAARVIIIDEVGPLELGDGGFAPGVRAALRSRAFLVLCVRPWLIAKVLAWANLSTIPVWQVRPPYPM